MLEYSTRPPLPLCLAIYEIASNTGTSVSMTEKYYFDARPSDCADRLTKSRYRKKLSRLKLAISDTTDKNDNTQTGSEQVKRSTCLRR